MGGLGVGGGDDHSCVYPVRADGNPIGAHNAHCIKMRQRDDVPARLAAICLSFNDFIVAEH